VQGTKTGVNNNPPHHNHLGGGIRNHEKRFERGPKNRKDAKEKKRETTAENREGKNSHDTRLTTRISK